MRRSLLATAALAWSVLTVAGAAHGHLGHPPPVVAVGVHGFSPPVVQVYVGDYVLWSWSSSRHSVTTDPRQAVHIDTDADTPAQLIRHPRDYGTSAEFLTPGRFTYHDKADPRLRGTVVVVPAPPGAGAIPPPTPLPVLSRPTVPACARTPRCCVRRSATVAFDVSAATIVKLDLWAERRGRQVRLARSSTTYGRAGANRYRESVAGLPGGSYELWLIATDATGNIADPQMIRLCIR